MIAEEIGDMQSKFGYSQTFKEGQGIEGKIKEFRKALRDVNEHEHG